MMGTNGKRLGDLLLHAGVVTKRQIAKGLQRQQSGDKRKLGDILIDMQYITVEDITGIMMEQASEVKSEQEKSKRDFLLQKQILKSKTKTLPNTQPTIVKTTSTELSESTKFTLSIKTILGAVAGIATIVGFYYMMMGQIDDAKKLPKPGVGTYSVDLGDPSAKGSWPPSRNEYKMKDELSRQMIIKLQEDIKELKEEIKELRRKVYEN